MVAVWSFGTARRDVNHASNKTPGPGTYNGKAKSVLNRPSSYRFGTEPRGKLTREETEKPGPGTYKATTHITDGPKYGIRLKTKEPHLDNTNPGPGSYNPSKRGALKNTTKNWSFGLKTGSASMHNLHNPGPGNYNPSKPNKRLSIAFGTSPNRDRGSSNSRDNPGPGAYTPTMRIMDKSPKYGFGSSGRTKGGISGNPGPGNYNTRSTIDLRSGFSMTPRRPQSARGSSSLSPGPGNYNPSVDSSLKGSPAYRVGTAKRDSLYANKSGPTPWQYNPRDPNMVAPQWGMGSGKRRPLSASSTTPGPGSYNIPTKLKEGPKYGLSGRSKSKGSFNGPGPGAYHETVDFTKTAMPAFGFGSEKKHQLDGEKVKTPGPGNYDPRMNRTAPSYGFGSQSREKETRSSTPGYYKLKSTIPDIQGYQMSQMTPKTIHLNTNVGVILMCTREQTINVALCYLF